MSAVIGENQAPLLRKIFTSDSSFSLVFPPNIFSFPIKFRTFGYA